VPQFVLDACLAGGRGSTTSIVCTQPRRISAIGLAERVASERAEECGRSVGYSVRMQVCAGEDGDIMHAVLVPGVVLVF
jgi:HrpA-like RNA helicase